MYFKNLTMIFVIFMLSTPCFALIDNDTKKNNCECEIDSENRIEVQSDFTKYTFDLEHKDIYVEITIHSGSKLKFMLPFDLTIEDDGLFYKTRVYLFMFIGDEISKDNHDNYLLVLTECEIKKFLCLDITDLPDN